MAPVIAVQMIGAATPRRVNRPAMEGSASRRRSSRKWIARWLAAGMVSTMICATKGPPDSDSLMWKTYSSVSVASQIVQPAIMGTMAHQTLCTADSVTSAIKNMPTTASRRPSTSMAAKPSARRTGGPTTAGRPSPCFSANRSATARTVLIVSITLCSCVLRSRATTQEHNVIETIKTVRAVADRFAEKHGLGRPAVVGPPVLLADGFAAIEVDGRRLAVVGMFLIALVTLSAVHSVWWAIVPMIAGWTIWLATETLLYVFHIKLSLSGGPLVAQIIVLTMPAASHLAIHFRDDRRREADPSIAGRLTLRGVAAPIIWTAITGAIGYGALVTSNLVPVQQFGAILGICTLCSAILVMVISPIAMMPPFPLEIPVREGSRSRVGAAMNRLTFWVFRHPGAILIVVTLVVVPLSLGILGLRYETNYINLFRRETRVVRDYGVVESKLGGIGLVELVVPVGDSITPGRWPNLPG